MNKSKGVIYILTNPSFPEYVKIGYADDVEERVKQLNRSECTPFAFRVYATYEVNERLSDLKIHNIIDTLNPDLRSIDNVDGKVRVREFYAMAPENAYSILEAIAEINGLKGNLRLWKQSLKEQKEEKLANEIKEDAYKRHYIKDIEFTSSITGKRYKGTKRADGTLCIIDLTTNIEVPNRSNPSKKDIVGQAIIDLGGQYSKDKTLYERYKILTKLILQKN